MNIVISGMRGSLGQTIAKTLERRGHRPLGLTRASPPSSGDWHQDFLDDPKATADLFRDSHAFIHCAGGGLEGGRHALTRANLGVTQHFVRALDHVPQPLTCIFLSSIAAGGPADSLGRPRRVEDPAQPASHYGKAKHAAEVEFQKLAPRHRTFILRLPTCHGGKEYRWGPMLKSAKKGWMLLPPDMILSHIHVRDVAESVLRVLEYPGNKRSTWNLCHPTSFHWTELPGMVERVLARRVRVVSAPRHVINPGVVRLLDRAESIGLPLSRFADKLRDAQFSDWRCDATKFYDELNYIPQRSLYEGLQEMVTL